MKVYFINDKDMSLWTFLYYCGLLQKYKGKGHVSHPTAPVMWTGYGTQAMDSGTKHSIGILEPNDNF